MMLGLVGQGPDQDLPQPGDQLSLAGAGELRELAVGFEKRFLDQIGGVEPDLQRLADQGAGQQPEIIAIQLQQPAQRRLVAGAGPGQEPFEDCPGLVIDDLVRSCPPRGGPV